MKSIAVFCGSREGYLETYREHAYKLGALLAKNNMRLVYGGAKIGLMGAVADGVLNNDGEVTGVIPHFLQTKEVVHDQLTELIVVDSMHERKLKMYERCDGVIILPGGWGTMDEMFEILTWAYLGMHTKPIGLLNLNGFYDPLKAMNTTMVHEGFLNEQTKGLLLYAKTIDELLELMINYEAPNLPKFVNKETI